MNTKWAWYYVIMRPILHLSLFTSVSPVVAAKAAPALAAEAPAAAPPPPPPPALTAMPPVPLQAAQAKPSEFPSVASKSTSCRKHCTLYTLADRATSKLLTYHSVFPSVSSVCHQAHSGSSRPPSPSIRGQRRKQGNTHETLLMFVHLFWLFFDIVIGMMYFLFLYRWRWTAWGWGSPRG